MHIVVPLFSLLGCASAAQLGINTEHQDNRLPLQLDQIPWTELTKDTARGTVAQVFGWEADYFMKSPVETDDFEEKVKLLLNHLDDVTLNSMRPEACSVVVEVIVLSGFIPKLNESCVKAYIGQLSLFGTKSLKNLPIEWARVLPRGLAAKVGTIYSEAISLLSEEVLAFLLRNSNDECQYFSLKRLQNIDPSFYKLVTPECVAAIKSLPKEVVSEEFLENARPDLFSQYSGGLNKETLENMTGEQLTQFGSALKAPKRCENINISYVRDWEIHVTIEGLSSSFKNSDINIKSPSWQKLPKNPYIMSDLTSWLGRAILCTPDEEIPSIPLELRETAVFDPQVAKRCNCSRLDYKLALILDSIIPSLGQYSKVLELPIHLVRTWLTFAPMIPDDLFVNCPHSQVLEFIQGKDVLQVLANKNKQTIRNINPEVCALMGEEWYDSSRAFLFRRYGSSECKRALPFADAFEYKERFPEINPPRDLDYKPLEWLGKEGAILFLDELAVKEEWTLGNVGCIKFMDKKILKTIGSDLIEVFIPHISRDIAPKLSDCAFEKIVYADFVKMGKSSNDTLRLQDLSYNQILRMLAVNAREWSVIFGNSTIKEIEELLEKHTRLTIPVDNWKFFGKDIGNFSKSTLERIGSEGFVILHEFITPEIAPKLPDNAFRLFTAADFKGLALKDLRAVQVKYLSSGVPVESSVFSSLSKKDILSWTDSINLAGISYLSMLQESKFDEFRSEIVFRWAEKAKTTGKFSPAFIFLLSAELDKLLLDSSTSTLLTIHAKIDEWADYFQNVAYDGSFNKPSVSSKSKSSNTVNISLENRSSVFAFMKPNEVRRVLRIDIFSKDSVFDVTIKGSFFELSKVYQLIIAEPDFMLDPSFKLKNFKNFNSKKLVRSLVEQMLEDFKTRFTINVPGSEARMLDSRLSKGLGIVLGALIAKSIQLDMTLPFVLHPELYSLIIDPSKENILAYYTKHYPKRPLDCSVDPSTITFTTTDKKSNLIILDNETESCSSSAGIKEQIELEMLKEFSDLVEGLSSTLRKVLNRICLANLQKLSCSRVQKILGSILDKKDICPKKIVSAIEWKGSADIIAVPSFIPGKKAFVREIFESIILALNQTELSKLMQFWTGASTMVPERSENLIVQLSGFTGSYTNKSEGADHADMSVSSDESLMKRAFDAHCKRLGLETDCSQVGGFQLFKNGETRADGIAYASFNYCELHFTRMHAAGIVRQFEKLLKSSFNHNAFQIEPQPLPQQPPGDEFYEMEQ